MSCINIHAPAADVFTTQSAGLLAAILRRNITDHGRCTIGLSGGSTPRPVYEILGKAAGIDWSAVTVFLVDDRCVRADSPHSNQFLLRSTLLRAAPIPESQVLFPDPSLAPDDSAEEYGRVLAPIVTRGIDAVVLGLGADGHIASLFPPVPDTAAGPALVIATHTDRFDIPQRISVTLPVLTSAREAVVLLGKDKKSAWEELRANEEDWHRWPLKAVTEKVETTAVLGW
ncbi:MAG: 6-phosphogluconolactonase [Candidatus Peregrinibacteria bacterium Gr01-1014_25]|nr:MAG: 6-phosphogluconolactonase [Candidatus Peregrinibacteria bacterium Gr01-1014_25]